MKTLMMTAQECVAVELGYNWVSIELTLVQINWICPTIYPDTYLTLATSSVTV